MALQPQSHPAIVGLIFGPQATSFDLDSFNTLRSRLTKDSRGKWALNAIAALSDELDSVRDSVEVLQQYDGASKLLRDLNDWLMTDHVPPSTVHFPNILLAPLVAADHLMSYLDFLRAAFPQLDDDQELPETAKGSLETLGLSLGTLSAFAVSSSSTLGDIEKYGAVAIRLAMLVGAVGDAEDLSRDSEERALSFSAFWKSTELHNLMLDAFRATPEAYVSVAVDEKRATITASKSIAPKLMQQLRTSGLYVAEVSIRGRFHWEGHAGTLQQLIQYCDKHARFQFPDPSASILPSRSITGRGYIGESDGSLHKIALHAILVDLSRWYETIANAYDDSESSARVHSVTCFGPERCVPAALIRRLGSKLNHVLDLDLSSSDMPKQLFQSTVILDDAPIVNGATATTATTTAAVTPATTTTIPTSPVGLSANNLQRQLVANHDSSEESVAVIGMACNVPGGEDMDEFWKILVAGQSQHQELPRGTGRFEFETPWREPYTKTKWYGNLIKDYDVFDHKFFKKGPREMLNTDPQHRLLLHAAYQTLEQAGYFSKAGYYDKHIACFLGPGHVDYASSVNCYAPNAYTATGNLKSMCAGKISHHFGWTGPILTLDTACSSSCVAIHYACRSILSGEVSAALAGGSNVLSSVEWYENLSGAQFLSPTGQCKPFDANADGYCRGDGIGLVFLKKLSAALADGDQVYGVIAGSKVYQNTGSASITVPNADSLATLFRDITQQARVDPAQVSVVEAHGTGTPVGDPAEYEAICRVFGGTQRNEALSLSSVKGLFGHTEGASGVCSLLKVLLMMHEGAIPPQASFRSINPAIKATPQDKIEIPTTLIPWKPETQQVALINNYGASGSNSSLVIVQPPASGDVGVGGELLKNKAFPFWIPGLDDKSIQRYAAKLRGWIRRHLLSSSSSSDKDLSVRNLSFQLAFQTNRDLGRGAVFKANSSTELESTLEALEKGNAIKGTTSFATMPQKRPVILCFGGQISTYVGLDREVYENAAIFRSFLDRCDATCASMGLPSIYPHIFQRTPITDLVKLQLALFAMQYSCAQAWMACGVEATAVLGHSFGELVASCVAGAVSLQDAVKMIAGRAQLIQEKWGRDSGAMMAVDAELYIVKYLLAQLGNNGSDPSIACYNGPRSFTLAGTTKEIELAEATAKQDPSLSGMRSKRLNVSNAFHSSLVDGLQDGLLALGKRVTFNEPTIRFERATEQESSGKPNSDYLSHHMRNPVYFDHAVQRLARAFPNAVWLEAGSNSTITTMASRTLNTPGNPSQGPPSFHAVNITTDNSFDLLVDTTTKLWKEQVNVTFWPHHRFQTHQYRPLILPPYQFEKSRHWLETKKPPKPEPIEIEKAATAPPSEPTPPKGFTTFWGYLDQEQRCLRFRVNANHERFQRHVSGHVCAGVAAVWPSSIQMDMVIDALMNLRQEFKDLSYQPQIREIVHHRPLLLDASKEYWLDFEPQDEHGLVWEWKVNATATATTTTTNSHTGIKGTLCTSGSCAFVSASDAGFLAEFEMLERLSSRQRCVELLEARDADYVMQGTANIYRAFSEVIDYTQDYQFVKRLVGHRNESAAKVVKTHYGKTWLDYLLFDGLGQTAGMFVNLMTDQASVSDRGIYMCEKVGRWLRSPRIRTHEALPSEWEVYAVHHPVMSGGSKYVSDIFSFDARDGSLVEVVLGAHYNKVPLSVMRGILGSVQTSWGHQPGAPSRVPMNGETKAVPSGNQFGGSQLQHTGFKALAPLPPALTNGLPHMQQGNTLPPLVPPAEATTTRKTASSVKKVKKPKGVSGDAEASTKTRGILENLTGVEASSINDDSSLVDLGLDSLLSMELIRDVEDVFKVTLDAEKMLDLSDFASLVQYIRDLRGDAGGQPEEDETEDEAESEVDGQDQTFQAQPRENHVSGVPRANGVVDKATTNARGAAQQYEVALDSAMVLDVFRDIKGASDDFIVKNNFDTYCSEFMPRSEELSMAIFINALEELGCPLRAARAGTKLARVQHLPRHKKVVDYIYEALEKKGGLIEISNVNGEQVITRTSSACPSSDTETMLDNLLRDRPAQDAELKLMRITGRAFGKCLAGKADALPLLFGSAEGRALMTKLYATSTLCSTILQQLEALIEKIGRTWPRDANAGPLRVLEVGAGTGGTTAVVVPALARLGIPVEYTMTDVSSFFTATARARFKEYHSLMKFRTVDIEKRPEDPSLVHTQHIVLGSNVIHATRDLSVSLANIHRMLRPDGFIVYHELTSQLLWADVIFGLVEGWWLFEDGRRHALQSPQYWEKILRSVGYGHVDWTDGARPEAKIQNLIFAMASQPPASLLPAAYDRTASALPPPSPPPPSEPQSRRQPVSIITVDQLADITATIDSYVHSHSAGFSFRRTGLHGSGKMVPPPPVTTTGRCVLITGATGSLGAHLVAYFAARPDVSRVVCLNRITSSLDGGATRQDKAFESKGISLDAAARSRLQVIETDASKDLLGLSATAYDSLAGSVTDIVHNAWPMSINRGVRAYEGQFRTMRNLVHLARDAAEARPGFGFRFGFQFVSSIGVVGMYPLGPVVPEEPMAVGSVVPSGYGYAKLACERILDATLRRFPDAFAASSVRVNQVAGSAGHGYWNSNEHLVFLIRSSQTLGALPDLGGHLTWCPVDTVAAALGELLLSGVEDTNQAGDGGRDDGGDSSSCPPPVYHIENPSRQSYKDMIRMLADALGIPCDEDHIIPFDDWVRRVREFEGPTAENPAKQVVEFFDEHFLRMSCGDLILDTSKSRQHSPALRSQGVITRDLVMKYVEAWRRAGVLK